MTSVCPEENEFLDYAAGRLRGESLLSIESHLDLCSGCRALGAVLLAEGEPEAPVSIDRFVVRRLLGVGATGVVYAAYDPKLDREVAIKLLYADAHNAHTLEQKRTRLEREARAMAKVAHPNVVTVYDVGAADGRLFIALALIEGMSLRRWLATAKHPWPKILAVFLAAGRGLEAVHAAGLLHRDFKPENVMIGTHGGVWLTDFGLAKVAESRAAMPADDHPVRRSSAFFGTPAYMAPEQLAGQALDARADMFSFSVAFYEALFGERPHAGATVGELRQALTRDRVSPPSSPVPRWLVRNVLRGLARNPQARPASIKALLDPIERRAQFRRRWPAVVTAALLAVVVLAVGYRQQTRCDGGTLLAASVWGPAQKNVIASRFAGTAPFLKERIDGFASHFSSAYRQNCEAVQHGDVSASLGDVRQQCLQNDLAELDAKTRLLSAATTIDDVVAFGDKLPSPADCLSVSALVAPLPQDQRRRADIDAAFRRLAEAQALDDAGQKNEARSIVDDLLATRDATDYAPLTAALEVRRAETFMWGDPLQALTALRRASLEAEKGGDDRLRAEAALQRAGVQTYLGSLAAADAALDDAVAISARLGDGAELQAQVELRRSKLDQRRERYDDGVRHIEHALAIENALASGEAHPELGILITACMLGASANTDQAMARCEQAFTAFSAAYGSARSWRLAFLYDAMGVIYNYRGELSAARDEFERTIAIITATFGDSTPLLTEILLDHGRVLLKLGQVDLALADFHRARGLLAQKEAVLRPERVDVLFAQAEVELARKQRHAAARLLDETDALVDQVDAPEETAAHLHLLRAQTLPEGSAAARELLLSAKAWFSQTPAWHGEELRTIENWLVARSPK